MNPLPSKILPVALFGVTLLSFSTQPSNAKTFKRVSPIARTAIATTVVPTSADSFVDAVGTDSMFSDPTEPYVTQWSRVGPELVSSGIRHLRDAGSGTNYDSRMAYLFSNGITHSLFAPIGSSASAIRSIVAAGNGEVDAIEGPNEYDVAHSTQTNWTGTLKSYQSLLYKTVKNDPLATGISVLGPPLANANYYSLLGDMDPMEDAGSLHESSCDYNPGTYHSDGVSDWITAGRVSTPTKPLWTTEAGYTADLTRPCSVPQDVAAKYDTRLIAQYLLDGGGRLYFFQLVDTPADVMFGGKGLIDQYGNPKLQFTAIASLLNLLSDRGAAPTIAPLTYTLSGQTTGVETMLLQRRDGSYDMLIWQEVPSWNHDTRVRIAVPAETVSLTFAGTPRFAHLWTYNAAEQLTAQKIPITGPTVTFPVTDSISVLHFH
jgi:hypothetical protein